MDKRSWLNLLIFVVLLQLGVLIYLSRVMEQRPEPPLIGLDRELESLLFQPLAGERMVVQRQAGRWWLQEPFHAPADPLRIEAALAIRQAEVRSQYPIEGLNLVEFGLQPPRAVLQLGEVSLAFGDKSPSGKRYVRLDQTLFLLDDVYLPLWAGGGRELVQRRPFEPTASLISIETPYIQIEKKAGLWSLSSTQAPALAAEQLAESWRFALAEAVLPFSGEATGARLILRSETQSWRYRVVNEEPLTLVPEGADYQLRFSAALSRELLFLPQRAEAFLDQ
ncbi:MAG: hypothetical protein Q9N68_07040 [Gammaproteobacteria bacterium]|nr:hypothetical protein [Gammaproteobacteria bacterium]